MQAQAFAEGYQAILTPEQIHRQPHSALIREAQTWSYRWGLFLHARLSGQEPSVHDSVAEQQEYLKWVRTDFPGLVDRINTLRSDDAIEARNEMNFHWLNLSMMGMWDPILTGRTELSKGGWLAVAQDTLALRGFQSYRLRQQFVNTRNSHLLFEPENEKNYGGFTGILQEFDGAISSTDVLRFHPDPRCRNATLVPAPLQFERSSRKSRNVDFIWFDYVENQAIGVQVKTGVTEEDYRNSDQQRVVFIDGKVDLDNVRPVRTRKGQSYERIVPWPGIIAAKRVEGIKTYGRGLAQLALTGIPIHKLKLEARGLVGNIRVDNHAIVRKIGDRILAKLYE